MSEDNKQESKGLGDSIKKVTETLGIKQCSKCKKRQEALNKMFPYKTKQQIAANRIRPTTSLTGL